MTDHRNVPAKLFAHLKDPFGFAVPMAGIAGARKVRALTIKIKLEGGARSLILGLCKVGRGPSRWATAMFTISNISCCGHCFQIQGSHGSKKISQVAATQNMPAVPLANFEI